MDYSKEMRKLRGDMTLVDYSELTGISHRTQRLWETGKYEPNEQSINSLADRFGWSERKRMKFMPKPRGKGLSARLERHLQLIRITKEDAALILGVTSATVHNWTKKTVPKSSRSLVKLFLEMSTEEVQLLLAKHKHQPKDEIKKKERVKLNYTVIHELEREFGSLKAVPDDNEDLKKIQRQMEWAKYS